MFEYALEQKTRVGFTLQNLSEFLTSDFRSAPIIGIDLDVFV